MIEMDSTRLRNEIVVDYVEVGIVINSPSQAKHINKAIGSGATSVIGYDEATGEKIREHGGNGNTTRFGLRIQDPKGFHQVKELAKRINATVTCPGADPMLESPPHLSAIEIALDAYCANGTIQELAEIAADRYVYGTLPPRDCWYFYREKGEGRIRIIDKKDKCHERSYGVMSRRAIVKLFAEGWNLTDCNSQTAELRQHLYVKITDGKDENGEPNYLKPHEWRARTERTLKGAMLPRDLDTIDRIDFGAMSRLFEFRQPNANAHPAIKDSEIQDRLARLAHRSGRQIGKAGNFTR